MLQLVAAIAVIFLGNAALFAWLQYRPTPEEQTRQSNVLSTSTKQLISKSL
ncbi:hypothetical protein HC931_05170 [Candidatus Gracilibacteria bacterium]|nr:hypothetical protein [Candidatus Gracilibacteria bacterium]